MTSRDDLWQTLYQQYVDLQQAETIPSEHLVKLDDLIFAETPEQIRTGLSLLFALAPVYLCRYVTFEYGRVVLKDAHRWPNPLWMERAVVMDIKTCTEFQPLHEDGAFDAMQFHAFDVPMGELSPAEQQFCLTIAKKMAFLPAGTFMMGALANDDLAATNESPRHPVEINTEYWVGCYPVTQILWAHVTGTCLDQGVGVNRPVETVNWFDCLAFCNQLSEMEGLEPVYAGLNGYQIGQACSAFTGMDLAETVVANHQATGYRLLTEAEWEYAARGGDETLFAGSDDPKVVAWGKADSDGAAHPVGQKQANGFGLYDMSGNVWEWCWDWSQRTFSATKVQDPLGPSLGSLRCCKGGNWKSTPRALRVSMRFAKDPTVRSEYGVGFRICRSEEYL